MSPEQFEKTVGNDIERKKVLTDPKELENYEFDTDHIYTFDYFQQYFRAGHFAIDLGKRLRRGIVRGAC
jgi:hypothetical protein